MAILVTAFLVFARANALLLIMPVFSALGVPKHVPIFTALFVALLLSPNLPLVVPPATLPELLLMVLGEIVVGVSIGMVVLFLFQTFALAVEMLDNQMGSRLSTLFNPLTISQQGALGVLSTMLGTLVFIGLNLHLEVLYSLARSFDVIAPGAGVYPSVTGVVLSEVFQRSLELAVQIAAPALALVWMVNVFTAVMVKLAPNMNIFFSVGMVLTNVVGLLLLGTTLPDLLRVYVDGLQEVYPSIERLLRSLR